MAAPCMCARLPGPSRASKSSTRRWACRPTLAARTACSFRRDLSGCLGNCVFRPIVTARFGIVTAEFGNVTDHFGDVTDDVLMAA